MSFTSGNPNTSSVPANLIQGNDPSWLPDRWRRDLVPMWTVVKDVYDGLHTEEVKHRYLIQAPGEKPEEFNLRQRGAYLDEHFRSTLQKNAALVTLFDIKDGSPEAFEDEEFTSNVDHQGNSLKSYAQTSVERCFRDEVCLLSVSLPVAATDEEQQEDREAFLTLTDIRDVRAPMVEFVDPEGNPDRFGMPALTRLSIRRWVQIPSGEFGYTWRQEFWVYRLRPGIGVTLQIYESSDMGALENEGISSSDISELVETHSSFPVTEEMPILDAAQRPLKRLPFVWFNIDKSATLGNPGTPPLLYLAETLLVWFNKESQLDTAERRCNLPTPTQGHPGGVPDNPPDVSIGPGGVWHYDAGGEVGFAEPSGKALGSTHERQVHREDRIRQIDERFIGAASGENVTATAARIADRASKVTLEGIASSLESAFAELFQIYALFTDPTYEPGDSAGGITVNRGVLEGELLPQELAALLGMAQEGSISRFEFRAMLQHQTTQLSDAVLRTAEEMEQEFIASGGSFQIPMMNPSDDTLFNPNENPPPNQEAGQEPGQRRAASTQGIQSGFNQNSSGTDLRFET